jgi:hypothetical protein
MSWSGDCWVCVGPPWCPSRARSDGDRPSIIPATVLVIPEIMVDVEQVEVVVAHHERATLRVGDIFLKIDADQTHTDVDLDVIRAWWSLRSLRGVRWLVEHGSDPTTPGCEVDVLINQAV